MPDPSRQALASWLVGSQDACDIVVKDATVSGKHARLWQYADGFELEDLGSTNGTFVDGQRIAPRSSVRVTPEQRIKLGPNVTFAWPSVVAPGAAAEQLRAATAPGTRVIRIGRAADCDVILDYPVVSREHARITESGGRFVLEDLRSTNGTAVNHVMNRVTTRMAIQPQDQIYFGSYKIEASRILSSRGIVVGEAACEAVGIARDVMIFGRDPQCDQPLDSPMISWHHAQLTRAADGIYVEDLGSLNGTFVAGTRISGKTKVAPGQEIGLVTFRFQLRADGRLERRENRGNVSIEAVEVTVKTPDGTPLLNPVSLTVYPSELVALMGPAGAGKTTLLKALNGYSPPASGQVLFNGANLYRYYDLFRQQMGYVPQDDIVHSQLTVREALYFSAKLRTDLSDAEIEKRIDRVLEDLGILDKKNSLIGSPEKKTLSGGQRKRVNIALELVTDTPVLFLDEPTSGLSSYDAEGVVDLLKRLAGDGKTIITTIHQPSISVFRKFDDLIMISRDRGGIGALAYFGPAYPDSIKFFRSPKEKPAGGDDTAALSPEMLLTGLAGAPTAEWCNRFGQSEYHRQFVRERAGKIPEGAGQAAAVKRRFSFTQALQLMRRNLILKVRDKAQLVILLLQAPLFALLIVLIFGALREPPDLNAAHAADLTASKTFSELGGAIAEIEFLMVVAAIWFGCNNAARDIVGEWTIYQRERMVNLKLAAYTMSKFAILTGLCLLQCVTLLGIVYFFCGLKGDFGETLGVLVLASLVGAALGLAISARSSTTESAIALLPVVLLPVLALGGGVRAVYKMPAVAKTLSYAVPSQWAFQENVVLEAQGHACGYPPGLPRWDDCPNGGKGVDAATMVVPEAVTTSGDSVDPAPRNGAPSLRFTLGQTLGALGAMLAALLSAVLMFLKARDIH